MTFWSETFTIWWARLSCSANPISIFKISPVAFWNRNFRSSVKYRPWKVLHKKGSSSGSFWSSHYSLSSPESSNVGLSHAFQIFQILKTQIWWHWQCQKVADNFYCAKYFIFGPSSMRGGGYVYWFTEYRFYGNIYLILNMIFFWLR